MASTMTITERLFAKRRNTVAIGVYLLVVSWLVWRVRNANKAANEMLLQFDDSKDMRLKPAEMVKLLEVNGVKLNKDQVKGLFGEVDDENDGFDSSELLEMVSLIADLPTASAKLRSIAQGSWSNIVMDVVICTALGAGLAYLVCQSQNLEKRLAASKFVTAVRLRKMQTTCSKLEHELTGLSKEEAEVKEQLKDLESTALSKCASTEDQNEQIQRLKDKLQTIEITQKQKQADLQGEIDKWRREAQMATREKQNKEKEVDAITSSISGGLNAFRGVGKGIHKDSGADRGFSTVRSLGFSRDLITFGTMVDGKLMVYEADKSNKLGEGVDCAYKCECLTTGTAHALKIYGIKNPMQRAQILNDLFALQELMGRHPRIVTYERVIESEDQIFVLMELIKGKDLFDVVVQVGLTESQARGLFSELVEALLYLHERNIIHCDVKPENAMVLGSVQQGTAHLKLIDFGFSCFSKHSQEGEASVPHDMYQAPEHLEDVRRKPTRATDMWRLGCTLYVMLVQGIPFNPTTMPADIETRKQGKINKFPKYQELSSEAKDLISQLLSGDPKERPSTEQVLQHPWVRGQAS